jgi:hypothetical protein
VLGDGAVDEEGGRVVLEGGGGTALEEAGDGDAADMFCISSKLQIHTFHTCKYFITNQPDDFLF